MINIDKFKELFLNGCLHKVILAKFRLAQNKVVTGAGLRMCLVRHK